MSLRLVYTEEKAKFQYAQPGKHGLITYEFVDDKRVNVSFWPLECQGCKNIKYSIISSVNEDDLFQQLVCPNTFFGVITASFPKSPIRTEPITSSAQKDSPLTFIYTLENAIDYVGIVGKLETGEEVFYRPIELATLWGKWNQQTTGIHKFWMTLIVVCVLCVLIIWVRRMSRSGYRPLDELPE